jgi:hypothetical protein
MRHLAHILLLIAFFCVSAPAAHAWEYASQEKTTENSFQLRTGAEVSKKLVAGLSLSLDEDLRFDLYNSLSNPSFNKSQTTVNLAFAPIQYFKIDAGYTLKILGDKDWKDYNEWLRHRLFASATASVKIENWKLSLRERAMLEMRTDSVNPLEKNKFDWNLRSKLMVEYSAKSKPLKPYVWIEVVNTLNAPEYQQNNGHQYVRRVRTAAGVKWKIRKQHTLNFFYRFNYGYNRDINITKKAGKIQLTEEYSYQHAVGITYHFGS